MANGRMTGPMNSQAIPTEVPLLRTRLISMFNVVAALAIGLLIAQSAFAQTEDASANPFAARLTINGKAVTGYEVQQRMLFLTLLRAPGDPEKEALRGLTEDRLGAFEAKRQGIKVTNEQILAGMDEFAARANLTTEQFVSALGEAGVEPQTFRDFVYGGLLWREVVRARYAGRVSISETDIDRAIEAGTRTTVVKVLISELAIPVQNGDPTNALALAAQLKAEITTEEGFAAAARKYSASPSAGRGGRLDWVPLATLPPQIAAFVLALGPGEVSDPVTVPNAVILFQLRDVAEEESTDAPSVNIDYAQFLLPNDAGGLAAAGAMRAQVDTCNDLNLQAKGLPAEYLVRETKLVSDIPTDVALELAKLDVNESSTTMTRGGFRVFLMLCSRSPVLKAPAPVEGASTAAADDAEPAADAPPAVPVIDREAIRTQLVNQRLTALAEGYMEELRSEAIIKTP